MREKGLEIEGQWKTFSITKNEFVENYFDQNNCIYNVELSLMECCLLVLKKMKQIYLGLVSIVIIVIMTTGCNVKCFLFFLLRGL